jgi:ABC-type spermidine/putrescine transport system permease subunit II
MARDWPKRLGRGVVLGLFGFYLCAPLAVVFLYAFSTKWFPSHWWFPQELGVKWFREIFLVGDVLGVILQSYLIALTVMACTLAICLPAGYVLGSRAAGGVGRTARLAEHLANLPLAFPTITLGIGLLPIYATLGILGTVPGIVLGHMVMAVPYALRSIVAAYLMVPPILEQAARNLGADRLYIIGHVYLPLIWPGILAGGIFAFTWSLNEFVLTLLLGLPQVETLPVQIYHMVGGYYLQANMAAALSFFLFIPSFALLFLVEKTLKTSIVAPAGG